MTLNEWLKIAGLTDAEFARRSGVRHKQLVGKYRKGKQIPAPPNMARIHTATNGEVTANDFFMPVAPERAPTPVAGSPA